MVIAHEALLAGERQFDDALAYFFKPRLGWLERHQVRLREIAVIVRVFFCAHRFRGAAQIIPTAGFLDELSPAFQSLDLSRNFILEGAAHAAETVHVFDLDFSAKILRTGRTYAHVDIRPDHALFHVAVTDSAINEDVLERIEVFVRHFRTANVRLRDNFKQWHSSPVEIDSTEAIKMEAFANIFFQVCASDAHARNALLEFEIYMAVYRRGPVVLGDLIIFGRVGIKIILPIKLSIAWQSAIE